MYAVVETGGKQYKVRPGQILDVDRLNVEEGDTVNLDRVLLCADDSNNVVVGNPTVNGARVSATSRGNYKDKKVIVFKYKPKVRYSKKTGHRQNYTRLAIDSIDMPVTK
ncbi:MAG: 50S ribosomal protein L21 [Dehalococcoidales bacterium]